MTQAQQPDASAAAVETLQALGYTWRGGEQWAPPIDKAPDFNLLDVKNARIEELEEMLRKECQHSADEKLRADQMSQQHSTQAELNSEARNELAQARSRILELEACHTEELRAYELTVSNLRAKVEELEQGKCLHQIAEPAEDIWPCINIDVDEHGAITNAKLYSPGLPAGNHDVYPVRVPYMDEHTEAWLTCVKELERFDSSFLNREGMNGIECAASVIRELVSRAQRAAAPQAVQAAVPLPLLLRDIARDLGITVPQACIALKPLGNFSTNAAVTAEMARMLRDHFPAPAHPAEGVPTSSDLRERLARLEAGCNAHTTPTVYEAIADSKAALDELDEARQRVGISLAATQPAAQAVPVLYVSKGQLDNHRDPDGVDTDGAGRYLPARKTPKGNFTAPLYEHPAPAAQGMDADMFWDSEDGERCEHDIESIIEDYSDGAILKIDCAKSLPSMTIRVIQNAEGADYEIIDAALAAQAKQGGAA